MEEKLTDPNNVASFGAPPTASPSQHQRGTIADGPGAKAAGRVEPHLMEDLCSCVLEGGPAILPCPCEEDGTVVFCEIGERRTEQPAHRSGH